MMNGYFFDFELKKDGCLLEWNQFHNLQHFNFDNRSIYLLILETLCSIVGKASTRR